MTPDNEARARELAKSCMEFRVFKPAPYQTFFTSRDLEAHSESFLQEKASAIAAALDAAVTRGRIAGLEEAREIASGSFGWSMSVWRDMTKKDMTRLMAEAIVEAIDARLVTIAPPAETTEPATGSI